jgi:hypothetical protein
MRRNVTAKVGPIVENLFADQALEVFRLAVDDVGVLLGALRAGQDAVTEVTLDLAVAQKRQVGIAVI